MSKQGNGPGLNQQDNITRTVTNIENGVRIEVSTDDPALVQRIQERHAESANHPRGRMFKNVTRTVTDTDTGVVIEMTSDDPDVVAQLQKRFAEGSGPGFGRWNRGPRGPMAPIEGAVHEVTNLDNGVSITITSDDPAAVQKIQERFTQQNLNQQAQTQQNGKVARQRGQRGTGMGQGRHRGMRHRGNGPGPQGFGLMRPIEGTERTVTTLDNGVQIDITSEDPQVVKELQERFAKMPASPKECPRAAQKAPAGEDVGSNSLP